MKLLILTSRVPWPLDKGDKLRIYHQIRYLSEKFDVELIALSSEKENPDSKQELLKYCSKVHFINISKVNIILGVIRAYFKGLPFQLGYFYNNGANKKIQNIISESKPDFLYGQLVRVAEYLRHYNIPKVLDLQDAFSEGLKRRYQKTKGPFKYILNYEYKRMLAYEQNELDAFNGLSIITKADKALLPASIQHKTEIVANGVDFDFFSPKNDIKKFSIVFTGNMGYPPNIMAANYLINDIMPLVWDKYPNAKVLLAGSSPHSSVLALANSRVEVSGWLNDIRDAYSQAEIFVAPMQIGTGLQNKLLEAMSMSIPCITSQLANKALKAIPGENIMIAEDNSPQEFADAIINFMENPEVMSYVSENASAFVKQNYDWKNAVNNLTALFK